MIEENKIYEEFIDSNIEPFLEPDDFYELQKTSLKSASALKQEHRQAIKEALYFKDVQRDINHAVELIHEQLPRVTTREELETIKREFEHSSAHFLEGVNQCLNEDREDKRISLQELFGFSNETLLTLYDVGGELLQEGRHDDARAVYNFLCCLAPHIAGYWAMLGYALHCLSKTSEAVKAYSFAQGLDPGNMMAQIYLCAIYLDEKDVLRAKELVSQIDDWLQKHPEEKTHWQEALEHLKRQVN